MKLKNIFFAVAFALGLSMCSGSACADELILLTPSHVDSLADEFVVAVPTGTGVRVRSSPTTKEDNVLYTVSSDDEYFGFFLVEKNPVKDSAGNDWYKIKGSERYSEEAVVVLSDSDEYVIANLLRIRKPDEHEFSRYAWEKYRAADLPPEWLLENEAPTFVPTKAFIVESEFNGSALEVKPGETYYIGGRVVLRNGKPSVSVRKRVKDNWIQHLGYIEVSEFKKIPKSSGDETTAKWIDERIGKAMP